MTLEPRQFHTDRCDAEIFDHGAHVWSWALDGSPILWQSSHSYLEAGKPLRGGVPVCWPWFGPGRTGDQVPAHGPARLAGWRFLGTSGGGARTTASYELSSDALPDALPDQQWRLSYDVTVGEKLELALMVTNEGSTPFSYELALHTYLAVGDSRRISIAGLEGASYLDKVTGRREVQAGDVTITAETDRVYDRSPDVVVTDPVLGRSLRISSDGAANTVVWNPWVAKSAAMPDFGADEWTTMVCIEAGNVLGQAVSLSPGARTSLRYHLAVERS